MAVGRNVAATFWCSDTAPWMSFSASLCTEVANLAVFKWPLRMFW